MSENKIKALIIEDDRSFSKAIFETLQRSNYNAIIATNPDDALAKAKMQPFDIFIIDCMLPRKPGVELAMELIQQQAEGAAPLKIILMSGIYKDKFFVKKALQKTGAINFLTKPFKPKELITILDNCFNISTENESITSPLTNLFTLEKTTSRKIINAIDKSESIHSFELPLIYSLFLNAKVSGQLNITDSENNIFGLLFSNGKITKVDSDDKTFNPIDMAFEKGFLSRNDFLVEDLNMSSEDEMKGFLKKCITDNLLSPHALQSILFEQLENRLSDTINKSSVEMNFTKIELNNDLEEFGIDTCSYSSLLNKWVERKIEASWLKTYYLPWLDHTFKKGSTFHLIEKLHFNSSTFTPLQISQELLKESTVQKLIDSKKFPEATIYHTLHLLVTIQAITFNDANRIIDYDSHLVRLQKIYSDISNKNYFEVLNVSQRSPNSEIKVSFHELSKLLHPDKLGNDAPQKVIDLNDKVYKVISTAYSTLTNDQQKNDYLNNLQEKMHKKNIRSETLIESGKSLLVSGQAQRALIKFEEAKNLDSENTDLILYSIWARTQLITNENIFTELPKIENELNETPLKKRQSALYHFAKGLYLKASSKDDLAKKQIESAIAVNPNFLEARRELNLLKIKLEKNKTVDLLNGDLKDVVGYLFKKKG